MRESGGGSTTPGIAHAGAGEIAGAARAPGYLETPAGRVAAGLLRHHLPRDQRGHPGARRGARPARGRRLRLTRVRAAAGRGVRPRRGSSMPSSAPSSPARSPPLGGCSASGSRRAPSRRPATPTRWIPRSGRDAARGAAGQATRRPAGGRAACPRAAARPLPPAAGGLRGRVRPRGDRRGRRCGRSAGIHHLAGVELYRGRPIFHGLGNFVFSDIDGAAAARAVRERPRPARAGVHAPRARDRRRPHRPRSTRDWFANPRRSRA